LKKLSENLIIEALKRLLSPEKLPLTITPVEPKARTNAGKTVRELRERMYVALLRYKRDRKAICERVRK